MWGELDANNQFNRVSSETRSFKANQRDESRQRHGLSCLRKQEFSLVPTSSHQRAPVNDLENNPCDGETLHR